MDMFPFHDLSNYQFKHMDKQLLLPDDVLGLISALSKPACRHWREFKELKRIFDHYCYEDMLAEVEKKLYTAEADQVFAAFVTFKDAYVEYHYRLEFCLHGQVASFIQDSNIAAEVYAQKSRDLRVALYGEEEVLRREYE
jgi:hypothetical protein